MGASIAFADLPSKLRDYALDDNNQLLSKVLIDNNDYLNYMRLIPGVNDEYPLTELELADVIQPGNKDTFSPTTKAANFKARIGKVRPVKIDLQFTPSQVQGLWKTYLGEIQKRVAADAYDMPFEAFILDRIIAKAKDNLRKKVLWKGIYNASGTTPKDCVNGIIANYNAARLDGSIASAQVVNTGAINGTNAVDQVEKIMDIVNDEYKMADLVAVMNPSLLQYYFRDYRSSFGALPYNTTYKKNMIDGTMCELIGEPGLTGTDLVFITTRNNLVWMVDEEAKLSNIIIEKEKRNINVLIDFNCGSDFGLASEIWTNDEIVYPS